MKGWIFMFGKLFSPFSVRGMNLKNRIVLPAMGTKFAGDDRKVNDQLIRYHVARVKGGSGLNIVEVASVHTPSAPRKFLSISEDEYIPGLKKLTDAIHEAGGKAGIQLWQGSLAVGMDQAAMILVASDMPVNAQMTIPGITKEQIAEIVDCYGKAAQRAVKAGFDCVEFHCAHNYLPHSFLSGGINHRMDEYGGSFENRARFPLECIRAIRANLPDTMPLFMRVDAHDDYLESGLTIEDVIAFCKLAAEAGVDVLDVSRGNILTAGLKFEVPPVDLPKGFNIDNAARIRKETGIPTVGVGRINEPNLAEQILEEDKVDLVVMGRAQLADAEFCNKCREGKTEDIDYCVGCDQGCYDGFADPNVPFITCLRNPALGREAECELKPTKDPKTVLIAGGGIGGLEAAITLKQIGHHPILCEASNALGGQFVLAGEAPRKQEMKTAVLAMAEKAKRLGVEIRLNVAVTPGLIREIKPYALFNCIGAKPIIPNIPGKDLPSVVNSHDVLAGRVKPKGNVVVIGGGMVGMETAEYLARRGCKVTDLEMLKEFCADLGAPRKICVTENIYASGITPVTEVKVTAIEPGKVVGEKDGKTVEYPCDYAVMAIGVRSLDGSALEKACYENGIAYFAIGDAAKARRAINATREAFDVALTFDKPEVYRDACKPQKVVFVTGASGTMGQETLKQLLLRSSRFKVRAFVRRSQKNLELMKKYTSPALEVVWGDLTSYKDILRGVTGADYVLHIGAMVSPAADRDPEKTLYTNIGSTLSIIKAIKAQPDPDKVHFCYIGTVAMTGSRLAPVHWGRIGDPMNPSIFDYYALSKVFSELAVYESGLKYWVSIRQTGQHPSAKDAGQQPIIFHQPPNNVLEWSTAIESGICMANLCEDWVPESFWRKAYNLSSGPKWRLTCWELADKSMEPMGIKFEDVFDPREMARFNFHGHYFSDADQLDGILHFRCIDFNDYWAGVNAQLKAMMANPMIRAMMPTAEQMKAGNEAIGHKRMGFHWMFENNEEDWIKAFFGGREKQAAIPSMEEGYKLYHPDDKGPTYLDHGYDEKKSLEDLTKEDLDHAAAFRGGKCLEDNGGDIYKPIEWECADGHRFRMSVNAVLNGGHWCPECLSYEWHYAEIAKKNPFYAQVWNPQHDPDDDYSIKMEYSAFDIKKELEEKLKGE
jgi:2,4-dienoyl-CoA reductase-like NADH-dependent reductase (Old Yellow Enzyme family)/nucleoside-diphosphate-sugar epimerase/thioredoxin reductase